MVPLYAFSAGAAISLCLFSAVPADSAVVHLNQIQAACDADRFVSIKNDKDTQTEWAEERKKQANEEVFQVIFKQLEQLDLETSKPAGKKNCKTQTQIDQLSHIAEKQLPVWSKPAESWYKDGRRLVDGRGSLFFSLAKGGVAALRLEFRHMERVAMSCGWSDEVIDEVEGSMTDAAADLYNEVGKYYKDRFNEIGKKVLVLQGKFDKLPMCTK